MVAGCFTRVESVQPKVKLCHLCRWRYRLQSLDVSSLVRIAAFSSFGHREVEVRRGDIVECYPIVASEKCVGLCKRVFMNNRETIKSENEVGSEMHLGRAAVDHTKSCIATRQTVNSACDGCSRREFQHKTGRSPSTARSLATDSRRISKYPVAKCRVEVISASS